MMEMHLDDVVTEPELDKKGSLVDISWGTVDGELSAMISFNCMITSCDEMHYVFSPLDPDAPPLLEWQKILFGLPEMIRLTINQMHGEMFEWYKLS